MLTNEGVDLHLLHFDHTECGTSCTECVYGTHNVCFPMSKKESLIEVDEGLADLHW